MSKPKRQKLTDDDKAFYQGFAVAVASLIRGYDQPSMATDIMQSNGITLDVLKRSKVEAFDLKPIAKAWRQERGR